MTTIGDMNAVFDRILRDLRDKGQLDAQTQQAVDTMQKNARENVAELGKDITQ